MKSAPGRFRSTWLNSAVTLLEFASAEDDEKCGHVNVHRSVSQKNNMNRSKYFAYPLKM